MTPLRRIAFFVLSLSVAASDVRAVDDPAAPGDFAVTRVEYDLPPFQPLGLVAPSEVTASVHYPTNLAAGPFPIVIVVHGAHETCYAGTQLSVAWPCPQPAQSFPSYIGYDYLAEALASHGYIVVSVSVNAATTVFNPEGTDNAKMQARAEVIQHHLGLWSAWNTSGGAPFADPNLFVGAVDLDRVGTLGHSRGGEGVIRHVTWNDAQGSPYTVRAVMAIAPTDFTLASIPFDLYPPETHLALNDVPLAVVLPYCDGDVSTLEGIHFFDNTRYYQPGSSATKHVILSMGANHNFFNTTWTPDGPESPDLPGGRDDAEWSYQGDSQCGSQGAARLTAAEQRAFATAYVLAFFRRYLGDEIRFESILTGHQPPPASAQTTDLHFSHHAPESMRLDVNRLLDDAALTVNDLGQSVLQSDLTPYDLCGFWALSRRTCMGGGYSEPHVQAAGWLGPLPGLSRLDLRWDPPGMGGPASYRNALPIDTDVRDFFMLQFRAGVNFLDGPTGAAQNFTVKLTDGDGVSSSVQVDDFSDDLYFPPGTNVYHYIPHSLAHTIDIPLTAFSGIDQSDLRSVEFVFDQQNSNGAVEGAIYVSDIAFASLPGVSDSDGDGVIDTEDNCKLIANSTQCDTDDDGYGNHCDGDFDQSGATNANDYTQRFVPDYLAGVDSGVGTDMNCSGAVNSNDFTRFIPNFTQGFPGPSGLYCAGTTPCP